MHHSLSTIKSITLTQTQTARDQQRQHSLKILASTPRTLRPTPMTVIKILMPTRILATILGMVMPRRRNLKLRRK